MTRRPASPWLRTTAALAALLPLAVAAEQAQQPNQANQADQADQAKPPPAAPHHAPAQSSNPAAPAQDDAALIASAMRAAPAAVSAKATIMAADANGGMRTLRPGSNGFTCLPDSPTTPGPDPMCMDAAALAWANAWMGHQPPPSGQPGLMYMLEGGTDASNTDPYATAPAAGNHWVETGPHVMVVGAGEAFYAQYPRQAQPDTAAPYVMWAGTPYQHLMVPVK